MLYNTDRVVEKMNYEFFLCTTKDVPKVKILDANA